MLTQPDPLHEAAAAWLEDLQELRIMLSQRIEQWAEGYLAIGRTEGRLEGEIGVLTRRFGALPTWAENRLNAATEEGLAEWADAVLDASSLADVLGPPPADH